MLLVPSAVKTVLPISQNRMDLITLNKQLGNHLNPSLFPLFLLVDASILFRLFVLNLPTLFCKPNLFIIVNTLHKISSKMSL